MKFIYLSILVFIFSACSSENNNDSVDNEQIDTVTIIFSDIELSINENPVENLILHTLNATVENSNQTPNYTITSQSITGAIVLDGNDIIVSNPKDFDFETNMEITGQIIATIDDISETADFRITITDVEEFETDESKFITTWKTTTENEDITIYINPFITSNYNYTVEWGDGTISTSVTNDITHNYSDTGIHTVKISGDFPAIFNRTGSNAVKIETIENWGNISWRSMSEAFSWCTNLKLNATDIPDLSQVTSMGEMFRNATSFNGDLNSWDVSNIDYMWATFEGATSFNQDLNNWNVSKVINMKDMFLGASSFNGNISNWDVSSLLATDNMFNKASSFNQDLSNWDVSNVISMTNMFASASSFNSDISKWNVTKVTNMEGMFYEAKSFNQDLNNWNLGNVKNTIFMFRGATSFNGNLSDWNVSNVTNMHSMFRDAISFNSNISNWNVSNVTHMHLMFNGSVIFNQNLSNWNTNKVIGCTDFSLNSNLSDENKPILGGCDF